MDKQVDAYIGKQKSSQKDICREIRKTILRTFPGIKEEMRWSVPCYDEGKFCFVALKDHVNIGFSINGLSKKEIGLFEGNGKFMRHIKIFSLKEIGEKKIVLLLKLVKKSSKYCTC